MEQRLHKTPCGTIRYWTNTVTAKDGYTLVFLPGLTADHRLFDRQIVAFQASHRVLVWDAPGHAASWPFALSFSLMDKAKWLHEILQKERIANPVLIGQSMGGYVAQAFMQQFPSEAKGFISIDSAPLQRRYVTKMELWMLKWMEPVYRYYPWKWLLRSGSNGCATSVYGRTLMRDMMLTYQGDQARYARLAGHGYRILAEAMEAELPYRVDCPALLMCGEQDKAGSTKRYNRAWHAHSGIPLVWIKGAGHNANTDRPDEVNDRIAHFLTSLPDLSAIG